MPPFYGGDMSPYGPLLLDSRRWRLTEDFNPCPKTQPGSNRWPAAVPCYASHKWWKWREFNPLGHKGAGSTIRTGYLSVYTSIKLSERGCLDQQRVSPPNRLASGPEPCPVHSPCITLSKSQKKNPRGSLGGWATFAMKLYVTRPSPLRYPRSTANNYN